MPRYATRADRLIANSYLSDTFFYNGTPCWMWAGATKRNRSGMLYGRLSFRYKSGPRKGKVYQMAAHRASVKAFHKGKRITPKVVVIHLCNMSLCINPAHVIGGTQIKNVRQCVKDGRHKTPFRDPEKESAMNKRQPYKPSGLLLTSVVMAAMREKAFGVHAYFETKDITERAIRMRDDDGLLKAAEEKRQRKLAKRRAQK